MFATTKLEQFKIGCFFRFTSKSWEKLEICVLGTYFTPPPPIWAKKLPIFHTYHTYSESRHPKVTKNPYNPYRKR